MHTVLPQSLFSDIFFKIWTSATQFTPLDYDSKWGKEVWHNLLELDFTFSPSGEICWNFLNSNNNEKNKQWKLTKQNKVLCTNTWSSKEKNDYRLYQSVYAK